VAAATPADRGEFQQKALTMPKRWRHQHAKEGCDELLSPNTVSKWSRQLMAAFERAKRGWRICNPWTNSSGTPGRPATSELYHKPTKDFQPSSGLSGFTFLCLQARR
jgi:hypothetical protein